MALRRLLLCFALVVTAVVGCVGYTFVEAAYACHENYDRSEDLFEFISRTGKVPVLDLSGAQVGYFDKGELDSLILLDPDLKPKLDVRSHCGVKVAEFTLEKVVDRVAP